MTGANKEEISGLIEMSNLSNDYEQEKLRVRHRF